jgi:subtilase-type serine protease
MTIVFMTIFLLGSLGESSSNVISSSTTSVLSSGTSLTYNSTNATTQAATTEFKYFNGSSDANSQNPLEIINAHKAYGYGLTGSGETIAIMDSGFWTGHQELAGSGKSITSYGTLVAATGSSASADHGLFVSSIAAGEDDGTGMQGVAPGASLHLSDYYNNNGNPFWPAHWALATDNASTAVVQNNSWGMNTNYSALTAYMSDNSVDASTAYSAYYNSAGYTANKTSWDQYITALNNFQSHGVIVRSISNSTSELSIDAAIPEQYSQLAEAWIAAVNIEITGTSGNETYTRKSAPCGVAGKYCLGADGWQVNGAKYTSGGDAYHESKGGTSFVAPMISGGVALLAEAFPNHTPEQLTDRLLASADNSFFTHDAAVSFANGVSHGYDDEFGHGVMDVYAALQPITSSSFTQVFTGNSLDDNSSFNLNNSMLSTSSSLGDSLSQGLIGEVGYTYDDLGGGFEYDMSYHVNLISNNKPKFNLSEELKSLTNPIDNSLKTKDSLSLNQGISIGLSALPVQSFFDLNSYSSPNLQSYHTPYLDSNEGGLGIGGTFDISNTRLLVGATMPIEFNNGQRIGSKKSLVSSLEYGNPQSQSVTLMTGLSQENDSLLGSIGSNAFSLDGAKSTTTFTALKAQKHLFDNLSLTGIVTHANTNMTSPSNSLVDSARDVKSSSIALVADMRNLSNNDQLSIFVNQPNRVDSGSIAIKTASLADSNRNINQTIKNIDLDSSSRQLNYGLSYRKDLNENLAFSVKHIIINNLNHSDNSNRLHSSYIGMNYKNLKLGFASNPNDSSIETELSYAIAL